MPGKTKAIDVDEARRLRDEEHLSWDAIGQRLGVTGPTVQRHIDPKARAKINNYMVERNAQQKDGERRTNHMASRKTPNDLVPAPVIDERTTQQRFFGDPRPGMSAWDQMTAKERQKHEQRERPAHAGR